MSWENFLLNEKLNPKQLGDKDILKLLSLCDKLRAIRAPVVNPYPAKLDSRRLVCETAIDSGFDLLELRNKFTGKRLIGRGLLDVWTVVYKASIRPRRSARTRRLKLQGEPW